MEYRECLDYMQQHCQSGIPGGFARTARMAELLHNPQKDLRVIHIAGTNGKGSTAAAIEAMLRQAGYRVGLFTSPHLERYEERIQINRQLITESDFAAILSRLFIEIVPILLAEGMAHPGEFELLTVAGWLYFKNCTDFVISEVGLGGTLDPTNVIERPLLTILTPISLDHCQILGDTVAKIAGEKAGILKAGVPAIVAPQEETALQVIQERAARLAVPLTVLDRNTLSPVTTNLQGQYQQINCNVALAAVRNLLQRNIAVIIEMQMLAGLQQVQWPGRMEYIPLKQERGILLDGAHNKAGMEALAENLRILYADRKIILFLSILDDKEQDGMLEEILPLVHAVVLTKPEHDQRARHWLDLQQKMKEKAPDCPCVLFEHYQEALLQTIAGLMPGQLLCITGSLYLLGDCRRFLPKVLSGNGFAYP